MQDRDRAVHVATVFCFSPANIFMLTVYTESLFAVGFVRPSFALSTQHTITSAPAIGNIPACYV